VLRAICDQHGILPIFDEVITGFGRRGATFDTNAFGVTPDVITCGLLAAIDLSPRENGPGPRGSECTNRCCENPRRRGSSHWSATAFPHTSRTYDIFLNLAHDAW
jgi:hypothetical protein